MTINGPLDITLNRRPYAGHRTPPEPRCARCGTVVLPMAPRIERQQWTGKMLASYHPGCWAAEQLQRKGDYRYFDVNGQPLKGFA